jgi:osmotically-inducible protein OsmY
MVYEQVVSRVREALATEPRIRAATKPIAIAVDADGKLTMEGEMATVAGKRLAVRRAAQLPDVITVVDRLRVAPSRRFSDEQIRRRLLDFLVDEPVFTAHELSGVTASGSPPPPPSRPLTGAANERRIDFVVDDGIVTLRGRVQSLEHKRLAGVLTWWVPGTRDVANALAVDPPQEDSDLEIAEGVRLALEKDPIVNAASVNVVVRDAVVHLGGGVAAQEEREAAEADAWYVFGVEDVRNDIAVTS